MRYLAPRYTWSPPARAVSSYGQQLGWLNEIVLALANKQAVPQETLKDEQPETYAELLRERQRNAP